MKYYYALHWPMGYAVNHKGQDINYVYRFTNKSSRDAWVDKPPSRGLREPVNRKAVESRIQCAHRYFSNPKLSAWEDVDPEIERLME